MKISRLIILLVMAITAGCYYDSEEELYNCTVDPGTIKYSTIITTVLNSYGCTGCHNSSSPTGGIILTTHPGVAAAANSGRLYGAISHSPGFIPMPQGAGKMNDCDIKKVKAWIDAGALNN